MMRHKLFESQSGKQVMFFFFSILPKILVDRVENYFHTLIQKIIITVISNKTHNNCLVILTCASYFFLLYWGFVPPKFRVNYFYWVSIQNYYLKSLFFLLILNNQDVDLLQNSVFSFHFILHPGSFKCRIIYLLQHIIWQNKTKKNCQFLF